MKNRTIYRRGNKYQAQVARLANARTAKERKRLKKAVPANRYDLPDLRFVMVKNGVDLNSRTHQQEYNSAIVECPSH
ncbi:hypothetical protein [Motiliproteus coralliicola]|uniref:hypothetical protein n=1 Tax=Motiliproteus coralliicola TaxID=2283196 RepID=UPI001058A785|nr:hypothetical protein [Motiliproteus coralliicola]